MKRLLKVFSKKDWEREDKKALKDIPEVYGDIEAMLKRNDELLNKKEEAKC